MIVTDRKPVAQKTYKTGLKAQCFCQVRMKDALGSGGTQQPGSVGEFLRSRKQDVYSPQDCQSGSKDVRAGHGRRAGDCLTGKSCGALMALNFPGHKNTNDSRLASSFPPSLFSFWQPYSLPWLFLPKAKEARLSSLKNGILSLGQPDELTHRPPWFSKVSASCSLGLTHCLPQNSIHPSSFPALVSSFSHFCTGQLISFPDSTTSTTSRLQHIVTLSSSSALYRGGNLASTPKDSRPPPYSSPGQPVKKYLEQGSQGGLEERSIVGLLPTDSVLLIPLFSPCSCRCC